MKKILSTAVLEPIIVFIISLLVLEFIVFPGLTINNTLLNICTGLIGIVLLIFLIIYSQNKFRTTFKNNENNEDTSIEEQLKEKKDEKI
jgi:fumarate reductase subunit D